MPSAPAKYLLLSTILLFTACQSKNSDLSDWKTDTLTVEFSEYSFRKFDRFEKRTLVRSLSKDTLIFSYYDDSLDYHSDYILYKTKKGGYALLSGELVLVNTFHALDSVLLLKFEIMDPAVDGAGAIIINPELGEIAGYSYSWGNQGVLKKYGSNNLPEKLIDILLSDSLSMPAK